MESGGPLRRTRPDDRLRARASSRRHRRRPAGALRCRPGVPGSPLRPSCRLDPPVPRPSRGARRRRRPPLRGLPGGVPAGADTYDHSRPDARPWLYGIAANLSARQFRSRTRAAAATEKLTVREPGYTDHLFDVDRFDAEASWPRVAAALDQIPDDQRDALLLHVWEDLSYDEIAVALDVPVGTVRSRISRGRSKLRELLADLRASTDTENG